jgi:cytochrome c oxidase cbb3-type subunit 3
MAAETPSGASTEKPAGDAKAGAEVFATNCAACHGQDGKGAIAPSLHGLTQDAATLETIIRQGKTGDPMSMPPFGSQLSDADVQNLVALIQSWRK